MSLTGCRLTKLSIDSAIRHPSPAARAIAEGLEKVLVRDYGRISEEKSIELQLLENEVLGHGLLGRRGIP